jgi:hypothetical protein
MFEVVEQSCRLGSHGAGGLQWRFILTGINSRAIP